MFTMFDEIRFVDKQIKTVVILMQKSIPGKNSLKHICVLAFQVHTQLLNAQLLLSIEFCRYYAIVTLGLKWIEIWIMHTGYCYDRMNDVIHPWRIKYESFIFVFSY